MGDTVVGIEWNPTLDMFCFTLPVNISKRTRTGQPSGPDLTPADISILDNHVATRRSVLSVTNSFYDPCGFISAYLLKFKLFMRESTSMAIPWDDPLPMPLQIKWRQLLAEVLLMSPIFIPRCVRPPTAISPPEMVIYIDGSILAYAALIYLLFEIKKTTPGPWISGLNQQIGSSAHLLTSKTQVTPPAGLTAPRLEINSLMLGIRLASVALSSLTEKPSRLTIISDSQCTVSAVKSNSGYLHV